MEALTVYLIQLFLLLYILVTFKFKTNIVKVIAIFFTLIPIIGIIILFAVIICSICSVFISESDWPQIRDNKLNRWLYNTYFEDKR